MINNIHKKTVYNEFDKSTTFIEIKSEYSKHSDLISVEDFFKNAAEINTKNRSIKKDIDNISIVIDPSTKKVKVNFSLIEAPSVYSSPYNEDNINHNLLPRDASKLSGMHMMTDGTYLYVWTGIRWKRTILSEW
jgi:hypothetical protein